MSIELAPLLDPRRQPQLLHRRRAEAILARVRAFAALFAFLTVAWIAVDAAVLGPPWWVALAKARLAAGAAFLALTLAARAAPRNMRNARLALAALFLIAVGFFIAAQQALAGFHVSGLARGIEAAYAFVPFLLACGIAAFPLTALESALLMIVPLAGEAWFVNFEGGLALPLIALEAFWLLLLLAAVATFAAMSQVKLMMALVSQAIRDPLTGCLRRESGLELLEMQLALALRRGTALAVLFADIDRFKEVNDAFGHEVGDAVLAATADALRKATRVSDSVVRWGGEEFVMILPDATPADAVRCVERLRALGAGRLPDGRPVTVSIGIAERLHDAEPDARRLVALADGRMYAAKQAGRNRYVGGPAGDAAIPILAETSASAR
jgi:diguanylate cyclase (GGDEF)-like protein